MIQTEISDEKKTGWLDGFYACMETAKSFKIRVGDADFDATLNTGIKSLVSVLESQYTRLRATEPSLKGLVSDTERFTKFAPEPEAVLTPNPTQNFEYLNSAEMVSPHPIIPMAVLDRYHIMMDQPEPNCEPDPGTSHAHLSWMLCQICDGMDREKSNRWLGFIQGILIAEGLTSVQAERDFTRKFFK